MYKVPIETLVRDIEHISNMIAGGRHPAQGLPKEYYDLRRVAMELKKHA